MMMNMSKTKLTMNILKNKEILIINPFTINLIYQQNQEVIYLVENQQKHQIS
jgi:hypothetical protein